MKIRGGKEMSEYIDVKTIEGLFDERAESASMHINDRRNCFRHKFINASLRWDNRKDGQDGFFSFDLFDEKGYGNIRFCERCKMIDCVHKFDEEKTYRVKVDEFMAYIYCIGFCRICGRRIYRSGCTKMTPSEEAVKIVEEAAVDMRFDLKNCGSAFFIELPYQVSVILKREGKLAAIDQARGTFALGRVTKW
jgi:hypothetical protein